MEVDLKEIREIIPYLSEPERRQLERLLAAESLNNPVDFVRTFIGVEPTAYQAEILTKVQEHGRVAVRSPHSAGKCLALGERVRLWSGELVPVEELVDREIRVAAFCPEAQTMIRRAVAYVTPNGEQEVVEIETDRGRVIRRTLDHPLWGDITPLRWDKTVSGYRRRPEPSWVRAGDLLADSTISVYLGNTVKESYKFASDDEIKIVAYLIGDGSLSGGVGFTQAPGKVLDEFRDCAERLGCVLLPSGKYGYRVSGKQRGHNDLRKNLRLWDLLGKNSFDKRFPAFVWKLDSRQLSLFLSRLYACDGWAYAKDGRRQIGYCTVSVGLAHDLLSALLRLGIHARLRKKKTSWTYKGEKKHSSAYAIEINDIENLRRFVEKVNIFSKGKQIRCVIDVCNRASEREQQWWRHCNLPKSFRWEKITRITYLGAVPTFVVSVPAYETFITDFVEHNSALASWAVLYGVATYGDDFKIITTASAWRQLTKFLWPEIHKWGRRTKWEYLGLRPDFLSMSIRVVGGEAFAVASDRPELIEGAHAKKILYILDESKAIADPTWDAIEGALTTDDAKVLAISTPGDRSGRFFQIHSRQKGYRDWWIRHVTLAEAIEAGQISQKWADQRKEQWGESSPMYQARVLGEFPDASENTLIPLSWIERAVDRFKDDKAPTEGENIMGVDVARFGGASSAVVVRQQDWIHHIEDWSHETITNTARRTQKIHKRYQAKVIVDAIGMGVGVVDNLRDWGVPVIGVNVSNPPSDKELYLNLRAELYWKLREKFMLDKIAMPDHERLIQELVAIRYKMSPKGQIVIESKDDMKKRGVPSPDVADALVNSYAPAGQLMLEFV